MIARHHLLQVLALLLPLMVLRAMLPVGFMPVVEQGSLRVVMCSAGLAAPDSSGSNEDEQERATDPDCAFSIATSGAPITQYAAVRVSPIEVRRPQPRSLVLPPSTGPPRAAGARAPPALS